MGYYDNPVDKPQQNGFIEVVADGDLSYESYAFYVFAVLRKEDGYYLSTDSGCSCPTPWESHVAEDFTGPLTAEQVHEEVRSLATSQISDEDIAAFLRNVV
jgi:hypothetical protein